MSVLIVQKVQGEAAAFQKFMAANRDVVEEFSEHAKAAGCLSHRFAIANGMIVVVDEWPTTEQFEAFVITPECQKVLGQIKAHGEPQLTIGELEGVPGNF
jgi:hypothetical protein